MKKFIFISGIQIFPPESGGHLRSANICRALSKMGHQVEIYSFTGRKKDYLSRKRSEEIKIDDHLTEYINRNPFLGIIQYLFYRLKFPPLWLSWFLKIIIPRNLKEKMSSADSLILDFPYLYPISDTFNKNTIVNTHNAEHELYAKPISDLVFKTEIKSFQKASHILFCSPEDQKKFLQYSPDIADKSSILPNGIDTSRYHFNEELRLQTRQKLKVSPEKLVLLFTASQYLPNVEAFNFLQTWSKQNALKLIEKNVVILAVGSVCQVPIYGPVFIATGKVDDVTPFFWASDYGINPVTMGSGSNVKMIEFMAAKLPILTTSFGSRGLKLLNVESCLYFEREKMHKMIDEISNQSLIDRKKMAQTAYEHNLHSIDMVKALKSINIPW